MPNIIYTATLDFTDNGTFNTGWRIKQGDFGDSQLNLTLTNNGENVFDSSIVPQIVFRRADGCSVISNMESGGQYSGYYKYTFVGNELAVPGNCVVDVKFVDSNSRLSTATCRFEVIEDTIGYDPTGASTYNNPVSALAEMALSTAQQAEAWAVGTKNGSPVSSGDPTYNNNAKYYAESISGIVQDVEDLQSDFALESAARASADAALGTRIDQIVAPSGEAPSAAEVTDARIGNDGITYSSLGTATRSQFNDSNNAIGNISDAFISGGDYEVAGVDYVGIRLHPSTGVVKTDVPAARTKVFRINPGASIIAEIDYESHSANRFGISLSNKPVPQNNDETVVVQLGNTVVSSDQSKTFVNSNNYKYCYIYYWTASGGAAYEGNSAYTKLFEKSTIKEEIYALKSPSTIISDFYKGTIGADETYDETALNRASSAVYATKGGCAILNFMESKGYQYNIRVWDANRQSKGLLYNDWTTERKKTIDYPYFAVIVRKSTNGDISDDDRKSIYMGVYTSIGYSSVSKYNGMRISILGDSISTYGDDSQASGSDPRYAPEGCITTYPGNRIRYPSLGVLEVQGTYWYRAIERLGMVLGINESWAGSRVSWDGSTESTDVGANKHMASQTRINHLGENGSPNIILINGGTNDFNARVTIGDVDYTNPIDLTTEQIANLPVNTFANAYRTMLIRIMKTYPDAKIICMTPSFTKAAGRSLLEYDSYCETIKEVCDMLGVYVVDTRLNGISIFDLDSYLADNVHYNYSGMVLVADLLTKALLFKA